MPNSFIKQHILNDVLSGKGLCSFALTEKCAGSFPSNLEARINAKDGKYILNGQKIWVGLASWAKYFVVFAKSDENIVQACIIERNQIGVQIVHEHKTLGLNGIVQAEVKFDNVVVQSDCIVKEGGLNIAKQNFGIGRIAFGYISYGTITRCISLVERYTQKRRIARGLMYNHVYVQQIIEEFKLKNRILASFLSEIRNNKIKGYPVEILGIIVKVRSTEWMSEIIDQTLQLLGGRGYMENNIIARYFRDARIFRIFEGPTETLLAHLGNHICSDLISMESLEIHKQRFSDYLIKCKEFKLTDRLKYIQLQIYLAKIYSYLVLFGSYYPFSSPEEKDWMEYMTELSFFELDYRLTNNLIYTKPTGKSSIKFTQYGEDIRLDPYFEE